MPIEKVKMVDGKQYIFWGSELSGRRVYCRLGDTAKQLQVLEDNKDINFHHRAIYNELKRLKDKTNIYISQALDGYPGRQVCRMTLPGAQVLYCVKGEFVFVEQLSLKDEAYACARELMTAPTAYKIERGEFRKWRAVKPVEQANSLHISMNGESEKLGEALQYIPKMIEKAHGDAGEITGKGRLNGFTHLYMPSKNSKYSWREMAPKRNYKAGVNLDAMAKDILIDRTAAFIQVAAAKREKLKWTIQGAASKIFCSALERVLIERPNLNLAGQQVHFFNPYNDPRELRALVREAKGEEDYTSTMKSAGNIAAMVGGHKHYTMDRLKETYPKKSDVPLDKQVEPKKLESMAFDVAGMLLKMGGAGVGIALFHKDVIVKFQENPLAASVVAASVVYSLREVASHVHPKMKALGGLAIACVRGDRRLDQLTETDNIKAYTQLSKLRLGQSI